MSGAEVRWLDEGEQVSWRAFLRASRELGDRKAAHVLATRWTGSASNVAVYSGGVRFYRPLRIGHLVEVEARLLLTGTSSMHISVHVRSGDPATGELELTTHALIVFVTLGEDGQTLPAPPWQPVSDEDVVRLGEILGRLVSAPLGSTCPGAAA